MKLLRRFTSTLVILVVLGVVLMVNPLKSEVINMPKYIGDEQVVLKPVSVENLIQNKQSKDQTQSMNFVKFDSLGNCYSYFFYMINKAFVLDPISYNLVTVKRGFFDQVRYPGYTGDNTKNNLFLRISEDLGKTWNEPIKIFDSKSAGSRGEGRYPSIHCFQYEGEFSVGYTFPLVLEAQSTWPGNQTGFYNAAYGATHMFADKFSYNGKVYKWDNDSRIISGLDYDNPSSFWILVVSEVTPEVEDWGDMNNIAIRKTIDLGDFESKIPPQWTSKTWRDVDNTGRYNQIVGLKMDKNNKMYMAAYGNFIIGDDRSINRPGVSTSDDFGETWSNFNVIPLSVIDNFAASLGLASPVTAFDWYAKDFLVWDNGDFSYILKILVWDGETYQYTIIAEAYYENGQWGIRKVADYTGSYIVYVDVTDTDGARTNPGYNELQASTTLDGLNAVVKWVDLVDYDPEAGTFSTTDVFIATRSMDTKTWGATKNITNSEEIDRGTVLPDYLPNDLRDIPLLKMYAKVDPNDPEERNKQFYAATDQWLMVGHFDTEVSVEETAKPLGNMEISALYPNPTSYQSIATVNIPESGNISLAIYNVMGKKVMNIFSGSTTKGTQNFKINTNELPVGTYYINLKYQDQSQTKMLNVIR